MPPRPGAPVRRATGEERAQALYFDQMDRKVAGRAGPRRRPDLPQPGVPRRHPRRRTSRSAGSPASPPRPASRCSCCTRSSTRRRARASAVNAKALVFSVKGEDLLFLDHANTPARRRPARPTTPSSGCPAEPFASVGLLRPAHPGRPRPAARTSPAGPAGVERVLVDARRVLRRRAAALRLRRRRGRAQPVHDGHPPGRRPAAPGRRRRRSATARCRIDGPICCAPTTSWSSSSSDRLTDDDARRDWAGPVTGIGTINAFLRRLRSSLKPLRAIVRGDLPDTGRRGGSTTEQPAGHGRRPAQPAGARAALRRRRRARGRDRPQGGGRARAACCSP